MRTILLSSILLFIGNSIKSQSLVELDSIVFHYYDLGMYEKAIPYAKQSVALARKEGIDTTLAYHLNNLGELNYYIGQYKEAVPFFEESAKLRKKVLGNEHPDYAGSLNNLGLTYETMGLHIEAEPLYREALRVWRKKWGNEHHYIAAGLNNLGLLYEKLGRFKDAEPLYQEAISIYKRTKGVESPQYATGLSNLAFIYETLGKYNEAEELMQAVIDIKKKTNGPEHPEYATAINNLALIYYRIGRHEEAEPLYKEALNIQRKALGIEHPKYAISLNSLAALYFRMNRYQEAEKYYKDVLKIREKTLSKDHPRYATALNNLAVLYKTIHRLEEAKILYESALRINKKKYGEEHPKYALSLRNLGNVYQDLKIYDKAKQTFLDAKEIFIKIYDKRHPDVIICNSYIGAIYIDLHHYELARKYLDEAMITNTDLGQMPNKIDLQWKQLILNSEPISYLHLLETLKQLYRMKRSHYEHTANPDELLEAKMITQTALELADQYRHQFSSDGDKLYILEKSIEWTYKAIQNSIEIAENQKLSEFNDKAFLYAEQSKSVLLSESIQSDKAHVFGDLPDSLVVYEQQLQKEFSKLRAQLLEEKSESRKQEIRADLNALNQKINTFKEKIEIEYPKYNTLKYAQNPITTEHIQSLLDEETAMIEYVVADSVIYLFCIDKTHFDLYTLPISKALLHLKVKDLRKALSDYSFISKSPKEAYDLYHKNAWWFYKELVKPAIRHEEIKHLLIIPDGELGHLPFEAFLMTPVSATESSYKSFDYLLRKYKVSYDYSASLWDENEMDYEQEKKGVQHSLILACAPSYSQSKDSSTQSRGNRSSKLRNLRDALNELPAAKIEVDRLSAKFKGSFLYGTDVNERFFKEEASNYGIIHLAMHGILDIQHPVLSSLAFTENGDSTEDNFLHAYEIAHLHLNAQLVVLSACETGYGKFEQGEGVISLARSFMYAGVPSLVVSMWQVNDASTSKIMELFYDKLAAGKDKAAALQEAKLDYLNIAEGIAAHPAFWAAFIQLGDSHPINIQQKGSATLLWWAIGAGLLVTIGAGAFVMRKNRTKNAV